MEKRALGKTGMKVTVLGYGAAEIGYQGIAQATVTELINAALDAGLNVIDTAECYVDSETLVGNAVAGRRKDFFLFTKCGHDGKSLGAADWDVGMLEKSIERSLKRLRTDHLDLLQLHSCAEEMLRRGQVIEVLEKAKAAGKTRFIGYSGDNAAAKFAVECGRFDVLQTSVSVADQSVIDGILPAAVAREMGVIAKRPVANAAWKNKGAFLGGYDKPYWERLQVLDYDFTREPMDKAIGVALRFTLACSGVSTAIVGTSKPGRWKENAELLKGPPMERAQWETIHARWKAVAREDWVGQT